MIICDDTKIGSSGHEHVMAGPPTSEIMANTENAGTTPSQIFVSSDSNTAILDLELYTQTNRDGPGII